MILRCEQIRRYPREIRFTKLNNEAVGEGFIPKILIADMNILGERYHIETITIAETKIFRNDNEVGNIIQDIVITKKILILPIGYDYKRFNIHGKNYIVYETGLGPNQHFYSFYLGDTVVGITHKDDLVKNFLVTYTLYAVDQSTMIDTCIFNIFMEQPHTWILRQ